MVTYPPSSMEMEKQGAETNVSHNNKELDAGALFVLKSKGTWVSYI